MRRYVLVLALLLCIVAGVAANMADPTRPGDPVGEPGGALRQIAIERETLAIDLRPLAERDVYSDKKGTAAGERPVVVEAVYRVRNSGPRRAVDLVFVANALRPSELSGVWLDDRPVPFTAGRIGALPDSWKAPTTTPAVNGDRALDYRTDAAAGMAFRLPLEPGAHAIRVRYAAVPTAYSGDSPTAFWQLGYVLAPARRWGGFGGLDVTVRVPPGWRAASDPLLTRTGDTLTGSWDSLPADALAITVQAPPPSIPDLRIIAGVVGFVLCILLGTAVGRWLGRRGAPFGWAVPLSCLVAAAYALGFFLVVAIGGASLAERVGGQRSWAYGYGESTMGLLLSPVIFTLGFIAALTAAWIGRRRALSRVA